ncbi:MAG TPA: hypothetical protein VHY58_05480 [Streptosporangiaceae bacterium]|jgi:hypothetical protein|nr:hypothetical protein [Streptosporangiaceae bacterium]
MTAPPHRAAAFYDAGTGTGGVRDWITLLHPPYTVWHLSYVAIGAAVAGHVVLWRLGGTLLAFFLAVGVGAHALDELNGRPLNTGISSRGLVVAAVLSIGAAMVAGLLYGGLRLVPFVAVGGLFAVGYNLELLGGVLHNDFGFALTWGAFPVLVGAYTQHWTLPVSAFLAALAALLISLGQRSLSTFARTLRRKTARVSLTITWQDGSQRQLGRGEMLAPVERALRVFAWALGTLAVALVLAR